MYVYICIYKYITYFDTEHLFYRCNTHIPNGSRAAIASYRYGREAAAARDPFGMCVAFIEYVLCIQICYIYISVYIYIYIHMYTYIDNVKLR